MARNGVFSRRRRVDDEVSFSPMESHDEVHVLAVDDSLVDRKVIEKLLKITSCKVTAVDSGRRALQFLGLDEEKKSSDGLNDLKVDLIITDYCMPGMTGYELLKKIKGSSTFREIPVVIMSSENVLARIDRCLEEGAEDFIVKPVKLSDVKRLKDYMFGEDKQVNKRKLQDTTDDEVPVLPSKSPSPSSTLSPPPATSVSPPGSPKSALTLDSADSSPPSSPMAQTVDMVVSSAESSPESPSPVASIESSPEPPFVVESSPEPPSLVACIESPTRRLKMSNNIS